MLRSNFTALATLVCLGGCAPAIDPSSSGPGDNASGSSAIIISQVEAVREAGMSDYKLSWTTSVSDAPVRIEVSGDRDFQPGQGTLLAEAVTDSGYTFTAPVGSPRQYFLIVPQQGDAVRVSNRVLPLEGGRNFRDLGGYQTVDGRSVKWGLAYRSGVMDGLTDSDYDYLSGLGISVVCDFRASDERASEPTDWRGGNIEYITFDDPSADEDMSKAFASVLMDPDATADKVRDMFINSYRSMHQTYAPAYAEMFDNLANGNLPLAFNCSAGKDRTGVAAALLLSALGVPRETVVEDYALSEKVVDFMAEFEVGLSNADPDSPYAFLSQLPPDVIRPLMRTEPAYIEATLDAIESEHGSVIAFIQDELGVDEDELNRIQERLLEN